MPWRKVTVMSQRTEFVIFAKVEGCNRSELCRRYGISRKTGYKWISRFCVEGTEGLSDRSRRPLDSPRKTSDEVVQAVLNIRKNHPAWGARKIHARLNAMGVVGVPAPSTITGILKRHGFINPENSVKHKAWQRFEAEAANDLWQMDFKGQFEAAEGPCHPLTVLDDHSRYSLGIQACKNQTDNTVREQIRQIFSCYGLPRRILVDNGSPWGSDAQHPYTALTVWLMRLGIIVSHSRPYHPQTLGKDERFHRSLKAEVVQYCKGLSFDECQRRFDEWRDIYNFYRPHDSLNMNVPANRYQISPRRFDGETPSIDYSPDDHVRKVYEGGKISFSNREFRVGKGFKGQYIALRPTQTDGILDVYFCNQKIKQIHLSD
jgi:transposase InsO family protein